MTGPRSSPSGGSGGADCSHQRLELAHGAAELVRERPGTKLLEPSRQRSVVPEHVTLRLAGLLPEILALYPVVTCQAAHVDELVGKGHPERFLRGPCQMDEVALLAAAPRGPWVRSE